MEQTARTATGALDGMRVLIPRGGPWGQEMADHLTACGAVPVIVPLIEFESAADTPELQAAFARLEAGRYDWLVITAGTTVSVLRDSGVTVPSGTRVAAIGLLTAAAAGAAGFPTSFVPLIHSAHGLVREWPDDVPGHRVLIPQSQVADATLLEGLSSIGLEVEKVTAYRAVNQPVSAELAAAVAAGEFDAIVITAGNVASRVADEFGQPPAGTRIVTIGPRTTGEAVSAGLTVAATAADRTAASLAATLAQVR